MLRFSAVAMLSARAPDGYVDGRGVDPQLQKPTSSRMRSPPVGRGLSSRAWWRTPLPGRCAPHSEERAGSSNAGGSSVSPERCGVERHHHFARRLLRSSGYKA